MVLLWGLTSMPARNPYLTKIRRLQSLETALQSPHGLHLPTAAMEHGVSERTIFRDLALLRELGHPSESMEGSGDGSTYRYRDRGNRLFAERKD